MKLYGKNLLVKVIEFDGNRRPSFPHVQEMGETEKGVVKMVSDKLKGEDISEGDHVVFRPINAIEVEGLGTIVPFSDVMARE